MTYPSNADTVIVQHYWWDDKTRAGVNASVTWTPLPHSGSNTPNLVDSSARGWVKTREWTTAPNTASGYLAVPLTASNDPDLSSFPGYRVSPQGEAPFVIAVDVDSPMTTVTPEMQSALAALTPPVNVSVGAQVKATWLTDVAVAPPTPPNPSLYLTAQQTTDLLVDGIAAHDEDTGAHPELRALIEQSGGGGGAATPDATTSTKGRAVLLGGTADSPTVPWSKVTGVPAPPTSLPPSGGAGGVLSGTYPNPGFAVDMATQAEADAGDAATGTAAAADATSKVSAHRDATDPHGDRAWATGQFVPASHTTAPDPHGDRAYADTGDAARQPLDSDLTAIAALDSTQTGVIASEGAGWLRRSWAQVKAALAIGAADLTATGTRSAATVLHGDNAWRAPAGGTTRSNLAPRVGDWYVQGAAGIQNNAWDNGALYVCAIYLPPGTYDAVAFEVTSAGTAGAVAKAVGYLDDRARPSSLLFDAPTVDCTSTGIKVATISVNAPSDGLVVWAGTVTQGSPATRPTFRGINNGGGVPLVQPGPSNPEMFSSENMMWQATGVTGAAPSTWTSTSYWFKSSRLAFRRSA